ncbi:hypothetical protein Hanom_Chr17g01525771 [Helianthus anomalus]
MSPRVRTRHGEVTAELAWSGSGSRSEITPTVGSTVHLPIQPQNWYENDCKNQFLCKSSKQEPYQMTKMGTRN